MGKVNKKWLCDCKKTFYTDRYLIVKIRQSRIELVNIPGFPQVVEGIATRRIEEKTSSVWVRGRAGSMRRWTLRAGSSFKSTTVCPTKPSTNCSNGSDTTYQSGSKTNCRTESHCQKVDPWECRWLIVRQTFPTRSLNSVAIWMW